MGYAVEIVGRQLTAGQNPSGLIRFQVCGTEDEGLARNLGNAISPATYQGLLKQEIHVDEEGGGVWSGDVKYGVIGDGERTTWSFDIGTTNVQVVQALEHIADYAPPTKTAPNHKGAINVKKDGSGQKAEGTGIEVPYFTWEETHSVPYLLFQSPTYVQLLESLTGKTNDDAWRTWGKGELLFRGASGSSAAEQAVKLTFRFASSRTITNQTIGNIQGITKEGWHYLWFEYDLEEDPTSKRLISPPIAAHVDRVYEYADLSQLGLADPWNP